MVEKKFFQRQIEKQPKTILANEWSEMIVKFING